MKIISILIILSLIFQPLPSLAEQKISTLSPWTGFQDSGGPSNIAISLISRYIEENGIYARTLDDIQRLLLNSNAPAKVTLTRRPGEIIVEAGESKEAIRFFDPRLAPFVTPFGDIERLSTRVVNDSLYMQHIRSELVLNSTNAMFTEQDHAFCDHLIEFARKKIEQTDELDPGMPVAAMIVDGNGKIITESIRKDHYSSTKYGVKALHAEVAAVYEAQEAGFTDWSNATIYVTMESGFNSLKELITLYGFGRVVYILPKDLRIDPADTADTPKTLIKCPDKRLREKMRALIKQPDVSDIPDINELIYADLNGSADKSTRSTDLIQPEMFKKLFLPHKILVWEFNTRYRRMFFSKKKPDEHPLIVDKEEDGDSSGEKEVPRVIPIHPSMIKRFWNPIFAEEISISRYLGRMLMSEFRDFAREQHMHETEKQSREKSLADFEAISPLLEKVIDLRELKILYHLLKQRRTEAARQKNNADAVFTDFDHLMEKINLPGRDQELIRSLKNDHNRGLREIKTLYQGIVSDKGLEASFKRLYDKFAKQEHILLVIDDYESFSEFRSDILSKQILPDGAVIQYYHDLFPSAVTEKPMVDMHIHSTYSDGDTSPDMLLKKTSEMGLYAISITDHDTLDAYLDPENTDIFKLAEEAGVKVTAGSEISSLCYNDCFDDGYYFTDIIALFPRGKGETDSSYRKRLKKTNRYIEAFRSQFRKCIMSSFFRLKTEYRKFYDLSVKEMLEEAIERDTYNGFHTEQLSSYIDMDRIEEEAYWMEMLSDKEFRGKMPKCMADFMTPLTHIVSKVGPENITGDINTEAVENAVNETREALKEEGPEKQEEAARKTLLETTAKELNYYILSKKNHYFGLPDTTMTAESLVSDETSPGKTWGLLSTEDILSLIKKEKGYAILAHPEGQWRQMGSRKFELWVKEMKKAGLYGIEAFSRGHTGTLSLYFNGLAKQNGLITTNGSDFHGEKTPHARRELAVGYKDSVGNQTTVDKIRSLIYLDEHNGDAGDLPQIIPFSTNKFSDIISTWSDLPNTERDIHLESSGQDRTLNLAEAINSTPYPEHKVPHFNPKNYRKVYDLQRRIAAADYPWSGSSEAMEDILREAFPNEHQTHLMNYEQSRSNDRKGAKLNLIRMLWTKHNAIIGTVSIE
ncbi:MAG: PHP domain-containing protein, partial [Candidatus Omnitrophica bacterium]|nr:PHP domain-containing protein [Candidatus Omnitrophota bacterium]